MLPGGWDRSGPKRGIGEGKPVSHDAGVRGDYNAHRKALAQNLVDYNLGDSIVRLGWEFNGGWYRWRASDNSVSVGGLLAANRDDDARRQRHEKAAVFWNPAMGWQQFPADQAWPGDEYVDLVGLDVYDDSWAADTYPIPARPSPQDIARRRDKTWNDVVYGGQFGLKFWRDFAQTHGKPFAIPEGASAIAKTGTADWTTRNSSSA